jgi:lipopolysaccharide assembly outer membrane protein LptD (OstA)
MRVRRWLWPALLALTPAVLHAQDCVVLRSRGNSSVTNGGTPNEVAFIEGADISCPGGKRLYADQAISVKAAGRIELTGNVRYRDADRELTAQRAEYYKFQQHIRATGNAVIRDLETGSTIYGQEISYKQAGGG